MNSKGKEFVVSVADWAAVPAEWNGNKTTVAKSISVGVNNLGNKKTYFRVVAESIVDVAVADGSPGSKGHSPALVRKEGVAVMMELGHG